MQSSSYLQEVADRIVAARGDQSQADFAKRIGVSVLTLRGWEKAHRAPVALPHIESLEETGVDFEVMRAAARVQVAS